MHGHTTNNNNYKRVSCRMLPTTFDLHMSITLIIYIFNSKNYIVTYIIDKG